MNNKGMTLIEVIVYLALFSLMVMISIQSLIHFWRTATYYQKKQFSLLNLIAAEDLFLEDIRNAPDDARAWHVRMPTEIVWQQSDDIYRGWLWQNNSLYRIEGIYKASMGKWHTKTKNLVVTHLIKVFFACHTGKKNNLAWIDLSLEDTYHGFNIRAIPLHQLYNTTESIS